MCWFVVKVVLILLGFFSKQSWGWYYGEGKVRGVNLGSWLVLEKWITPKPFEGLPDSVNDEYKLCKHLGKVGALQRLRPHWDTWVTEADFKTFKSAGLNHVRLPIGYWALDIKNGEPWVAGSWDYVVKAAGWAKKYGLQLMVDLHGAPGSQNGNDHSGQSGSIGFYYSDENLQRATNVIGKIAKWAYSPELRDTVSIVQLLNEPVLWGNDYNYRLTRLKQYIRMAYDEVRKYNDILVVAVHDAFIDSSNWYYLRDDAHYYWIMLDMHLYQVFGDQWGKMSCQQHYSHPCTYHEKLRESNAKLWTVVGEWSLALPNELKCNDQKYFAQQQIASYEVATGYFFWSHNNQQGWRDWSFNHSLTEGCIRPSDASNAQCGVNWEGRKWAMGCDFKGNYLSSAKVRGEDCSGKCAATQSCTHFTWTDWTQDGQGPGTCWMKRGNISPNDAIISSQPSIVCGYL